MNGQLILCRAKTVLSQNGGTSDHWAQCCRQTQAAWKDGIRRPFNEPTGHATISPTEGKLAHWVKKKGRKCEKSIVIDIRGVMQIFNVVNGVNVVSEDSWDPGDTIFSITWTRRVANCSMFPIGKNSLGLRWYFCGLVLYIMRLEIYCLCTNQKIYRMAQRTS